MINNGDGSGMYHGDLSNGIRTQRICTTGIFMVYSSWMYLIRDLYGLFFWMYHGDLSNGIRTQKICTTGIFMVYAS